MNKLVTEIRANLRNLRVSGGAISRKIVITISNGVFELKMP